jgi:hypothetical protein
LPIALLRDAQVLTKTAQFVEERFGAELGYALAWFKVVETFHHCVPELHAKPFSFLWSAGRFVVEYACELGQVLRPMLPTKVALILLTEFRFGEMPRIGAHAPSIVEVLDEAIEYSIPKGATCTD